ncbi:MAG: hypothetical protein ACLRSW_03145 [Christensenellaceae bacterium]
MALIGATTSASRCPRRSRRFFTRDSSGNDYGRHRNREGGGGGGGLLKTETPRPRRQGAFRHDGWRFSISPACAVRAPSTDKSRLVWLPVQRTGDGYDGRRNQRRARAKRRMYVAMARARSGERGGDIVILDNNFASIVKAIRYGRTVFKASENFWCFS